MTRFITIIVFIICTKICVLGQKNEAFTSRDIKNTSWHYKKYFPNMKINDTIEFKKSSYNRWELKFISNGSIIEADTFSDYSGKHFIRKKYKSGEWNLKDHILIIKKSKTIYHLEFICKNKNSMKFRLKNIFKS